MRTIIAGILAVGLMAMPAFAAPWFTVTSSSITDGKRIDPRFGADDQNRACSPRTPDRVCPCPGRNTSPALSWQNAPAGTKSFAVLMYDIDGQFGAGVSHWVAYNIAPSSTGLKEGDGTAGLGFTGGAGTRGNANYTGPVRRRATGRTII